MLEAMVVLSLARLLVLLVSLVEPEPRQQNPLEGPLVSLIGMLRVDLLHHQLVLLVPLATLLGTGSLVGMELLLLFLGMACIPVPPVLVVHSNGPALT